MPYEMRLFEDTLFGDQEVRLRPNLNSEIGHKRNAFRKTL